MNRNDLLYNAINNYFAIQTMNSFCIEAILEADLKDAQKQPLDMYSKMIPLFGFDSENIKEFCENAKLLSKLNINFLINFCCDQLDEEFQEGFNIEVNDCVNNYCDKNGNFLFTIDIFYDIMNIYWTFERKSIARRFDNGKK